MKSTLLHIFARFFSAHAARPARLHAGLATAKALGVDSRRLRPVAWILAALALHGAALAQSVAAAGPSLGSDTVSWSAAAQSPSAKPGSRLALTLHGAVVEGWHVYGLTQLPDGPTPLRVTLESGDVATADGAPTGSPPIKSHDPSFDLETQFYTHDFTVTAPVRLGARLAPGQHLIPVSVRFQTCNGRICQPPKTVHLSVAVNVRANG